MKSRTQFFFTAIALLSLGVSISFAQVAGDYGTATGTAGRWGTNGANWLVFVSAADWSDATPAPGAPTASNNVWIRPGYVDTIEASSKVCKNLTVQSGGSLITTSAGGGFTLTVNGDAQIDGTLGSATVAPLFQFGVSGRIFGAGTCYVSKIRPNAAGLTMTADMNITIVSASGSVINENGKGAATFQVNAGRTVALPVGGYISVASNSSTADPTGTVGNFIINVYGTLNVPITSGGGISLANLPTFTSTLNVYSTGTVNTGRLSALAAGTAGGINVNVNSGGTLHLNFPITNDVGKATIAIDGTFDCDTAVSVAFGTANVSSTGKIRLKTAAFPTGTVNLNSGSTVEYYGTTGITMPATPATYQNLTINNSGGVTLGGSPTVNGTLTLTSGSFNVGANTLTLNGPAIAGTVANLNAAGTSSLAFGGSASGITIPSIVTALNNLTINNASGVSLGGNLTVNGVLGFTSGIITTGASTLSLGSSATVTGGGAGNYVYGTLLRQIPAGAQSPTFDIGDASNYTPVTVTFNNVTTPGSLTASTAVPGVPPAAASLISQTKYLNRSWTLTNSGTAFDTYGATFTFVPSDIQGSANTNNFIVGKNDASVWTNPSVGTKTATSVQATGMTSLGAPSVFSVGEIQNFTITSTASAGGSITPLGSTSVILGSAQSYTFAPNTGFTFDSLLVDGVKNTDSTSGYTFANVTAAHTISVYFSTTNIILNSSAANGTITPNGALALPFGSTQRYTFAPNAGCVFDSLLVDGVKNTDSTTGYTFASISVTHTIAVFYHITKYVIAATADSGGTITPSGADTLAYGSTQRFVFTPNTGYQLDSIKVDGVIHTDSLSGYTFTNVTASHTIAAFYSIQSFAFNVYCVNGVITPGQGVQIFTYGSTQRFTYTPLTGYKLDSLIIDNARNTDSTTAYTFSNITGFHTIAVYYSINKYIITATATAGGTITPSGADTLSYGAAQRFVFAPTTGYKLDSLKIDGSKNTDSTVGYTFSNVTTTHTIAVYFSINKYIITATASAGGTITPLGADTLIYGSAQRFVFGPSTGYHLDSLKIDGTKNTDSTSGYTFRTIAVSHTIAVYYSINKYIVTATANAGATITPSGPDTLAYGSTQRFVFAAKTNNKIDSLVIDGVRNTDSTTAGGYTFRSIAANHTIAVYGSPLTEVDKLADMGIPKVYQLSQNYPNPFNPSTTIRYGLPNESRVTIKVYSMLGQEIATLINGSQSAGYHEVVWQASHVASGMYFFRIKAEATGSQNASFTQVRKMLLLK